MGVAGDSQDHVTCKLKLVEVGPRSPQELTAHSCPAWQAIWLHHFTHLISAELTIGAENTTYLSSEGCRCLEEGYLGLPGAFPDVF